MVRPMWVSRMSASQPAGGWQLTGNNKGLGTYGAVVIAHNGKCANRWVGSVRWFKNSTRCVLLYWQDQ